MSKNETITLYKEFEKQIRKEYLYDDKKFELINEAKKGSQEAKNILKRKFSWIALSVLLKEFYNSPNFEDLLQDGYVILFKTINNIEKIKNVEDIEKYLYTCIVRNLSYKESEYWTLKVPKRSYESFTKLDKRQNNKTKDNIILAGQTESLDEITENIENESSLKINHRERLSLSEKKYIQQIIDKKILKKKVKKEVKKLNESTQKVISLKFGFKDNIERTRKEVSLILNIPFKALDTKMYRAYQKLRQNISKEYLTY